MVYGIQKVCVFINFVIVIYVTTWNDGWMLKAFGCGKELRIRTPFWTCCDHNIREYPSLGGTIKTASQKLKERLTQLNLIKNNIIFKFWFLLLTCITKVLFSHLCIHYGKFVNTYIGHTSNKFCS